MHKHEAQINVKTKTTIKNGTIIRLEKISLFNIVNIYYHFFSRLANYFFTGLINSMEIQKINNSPSFQAIKLTTKEGRKVAGIIRDYRKQPSQKLKEQLLDIFEPHIKKEAESHSGIIQDDFRQNMYLELFDSLETVDIKHHPSAEITNRLNEVVPTIDDQATLGHISFEDLTTAEKESLGYQEELLEMYDAKNRVKKSALPSESKEIIMEKLSGLSDAEIATNHKVCMATIHARIKDSLKMLNNKTKKEYQPPQVTSLKKYLENNPDLKGKFRYMQWAHNLRIAAGNRDKMLALQKALTAKSEYKTPITATIENVIANAPQEKQKGLLNKYSNFLHNIKIAGEIKSQQAAALS